MAKILLACSASVAIYKACDLASKLTQAGHGVRSVLTPRAAKLVSPQLFAAVTGQSAHVDEFADDRRSAMDHIDLASWADLLVVAPASADFLARLALGLADDLAGTVALALPSARPRLLAPAMNPHMWSAPPTARHLTTLRGDGWQVLEPDSGHMACGVEGKGRMCEPAAIAQAVMALIGPR
jgi:phosphopantothenoylcysteine decarboxylase/phosphopantothenate--cysteine ligase